MLSDNLQLKWVKYGGKLNSISVNLIDDSFKILKNTEKTRDLKKWHSSWRNKTFGIVTKYL